MKLSKKTRREISNLGHQELAKFKDDRGNRLHPSGDCAPVREHVTPGHANESSHIRQQRESKASRTLGK